jgi:hypothetical protein
MTVLSNKIQGFKISILARHALLSFIAISGYLYYSYKFGSPDLGNNDFYQYQKMVQRPLDMDATIAPFVLRQIPTVVAYLLYKCGIFFDTKTNLDLILPGDVDSKRVFFALILSNALAVATSFTVALSYLQHKARRNDILVSFSFLGIMLSYFYLPFSFIAPLTYGWGWLVSVILTIGLLEKGLLLMCLGCIMALFSRESVLVFALAFSTVAWASFGRRSKFYMQSSVMLAASCATLLGLRVFLVHGHENQINLTSVIANVLAFTPTENFVFQNIVAQAMFIALVLSLSKTHRSYALALFVAFMAVVVLGIGTGITGPGRVIGEALPFYAIIFVLMKLEDLRATDAADSEI